MKILITVGTTPFDNLVKSAEKQLGELHQLSFQISDGEYKPKTHQYFKFSDQIEDYYQDADLIISHGVPNLDRVDHHQMDICDFMHENNHAVVCLNLNNLAQVVKEVATSELAPFESDKFTGVEKIRDFLGLHYNSTAKEAEC